MRCGVSGGRVSSHAARGSRLPRCAGTLHLNARRLGSLPPPCRAGVGHGSERLPTLVGSIDR
eukprot:scaffold101254_cov61-Phaeocystis_antarctica.AAC.2